MKKVMMLLAVLVCPFMMQAQTKFHDLEANDLKGPVKSVAVSAMGIEQKTTFSPDGKMSQDNMTNAVYDENGYLKTAEVETRGVKASVSYTWENGKIKTQTTNLMGQQVIVTSNYNAKGEVVSQNMNMGGQDMKIEYSDYKYDDKGNWISRKTSVMGQVVDTPRTIEYYE